jgi:hypothetical protein
MLSYIFHALLEGARSILTRATPILQYGHANMPNSMIYLEIPS